MATRKDERDGIWRYSKRVTMPDGRSVRIYGTPAINTQKAAEAAERAHVERTLNPPPVERSRMLMSDVLDRFMTDYVTIANNKASEVAGKRSAVDRYLKPKLGGLFVDEVDEPRIVELAAKLHATEKTKGTGTLGAKYVKNILQTLRKCLRWAKKMKWIAEAPEIQMPRIDEEEIRFLEDAELVALLEVATKEPIWYAAIALASEAGLRLGELRALRWTDYNQVTNQITISRSRWRNTESSPKSRKPRSVDVSAFIASALHAIRVTKLRGPYVLSKGDGEPYGAEHMQEVIERLTRNAKLTDCGWHTLRHTFCTRLAMAGVPVVTIQKLAGHASIATTMRYMHVVQGATSAAIALLNKPLAGEPARLRGGCGSDDAAESSAEGAEVIQLRR